MREATASAAQADEWLLPAEAGGLEAEGMERTWRFKQDAIAQGEKVPHPMASWRQLGPGRRLQQDPFHGHRVAAHVLASMQGRATGLTTVRSIAVTMCVSCADHSLGHRARVRVLSGVARLCRSCDSRVLA